MPKIIPEAHITTDDLEHLTECGQQEVEARARTALLMFRVERAKGRPLDAAECWKRAGVILPSPPVSFIQPEDQSPAAIEARARASFAASVERIATAMERIATAMERTGTEG